MELTTWTEDMLRSIARERAIDALQSALLELPQIECPVANFFGPGIYIRQVTIPSGMVIIGRHHRRSCVNQLIRGEIAFPGDDGPVVLSAPATLVSHPGRKMAASITEIVWQNIWATDETDLGVLEKELVHPIGYSPAYDLEGV